MLSFRTISTTLLAAAACSVAIFGQGDELGRLRASIRESEERMKRVEGEARRSAGAIEEYRRQASALDSLVDALQSEEGRLAAEMIAVRGRRDSLSDELATLRGKYGRMTRALFKNRLLTTSASILLLPKEHERLALRQRLFERYARVQRGQASRIASVNGELARHDSLLTIRQRQQEKVIEEKRAEMERLFELQRSQAALLEEATGEQSRLKARLDRQNAEANQIAGMIARMAQREDRKQETPKSASTKSASTKNAPAKNGSPRSAPSRPNASGGRSASEGGSGAAAGTASGRAPEGDKPKSRRRSGGVRFIWPISGRRIVEGYGERVNPETGTVTINPGINIAAPSGSAVWAAEDGVVSLVSWLPSYGTIVIVEHRDGYRTVYGNLSGALVSRGANVSSGQKLGIVGGGSLHFEVWREQTRMNPTTVLR